MATDATAIRAEMSAPVKAKPDDPAAAVAGAAALGVTGVAAGVAAAPAIVIGIDALSPLASLAVMV